MNKHRYKQEILILCKDGHKTADKIHKQMKKNYPYIGIGTIYRNLTELVNEGKLEKISGIADKTIYEIKTDENAHGHLVCENTGKIINVDISKIKDMDLGLPEGFKVKKVEVIFYGGFDSEDEGCKGKITME